jgi:transcriptional regulator of acetoin/glycerol metabolism/AraC-like DNA-binding protein
MATDPIEEDGGQDAESAREASGASSVVADPVVDRERWVDGAFDEVAASWQRSAESHRIDPASMVAPHILTTAELRESREPIEAMVRAVQSELDRVYGVVRRAGYVVLFCDTNGVAIDYRGDETRSSQFRDWGVWVGGSWSEAMEGTNGIGTCIAEQRPITVHQAQHFRARHGSLSCSSAPVFGADGRLTAVLDVSSIDSDMSSQSHGLTLPVVAAAARTLEERLFREAYTRSWIVALAPAGDRSAPLLAVDRDHRIVGADGRARAEFGLRQERLVRGLSLWDLFTRNPSLLRRQEAGADNVVGLRDKHGSLRCALVSAPVRSVRSHIGADAAEFLMRPRITLLPELERHFEVQPPRGGLSAGALRRVCEFVESHLEDGINLETLAAEAHLSVYHFARAFKLSTGVSPLRYVLEQRVKQARQLLIQTDLPLSRIACAVGFFDQGHFSRQFRSLVGTTPSSFRRTNRR